MKHYSNGHMTLNDYLMMYLARWKRVAVVLLFIWIVVTYLFIAPLRCTGNTDEAAEFQERLKKVSAQLETLKHQHSNLIAQIKKAPGLRNNLNDIILDSGQGPTEEYENLRRRIHSNTKELWYYVSHELGSIMKNSENKDEKLVALMERIDDRKRSLLSDQEKLPELDGYNEWRKAEAANVSDLIQRRLYHLQNPPNCKDARKLICNLNKGCGFGCQLHHIVYCLIFAYATERTLILNSKGWRYHNRGWEYVFHPISDTCTSSYDDPVLQWAGALYGWGDVLEADLHELRQLKNWYETLAEKLRRLVLASEAERELKQWRRYLNHDAKVVALPFIDSLSQKPKFLPLSVPKDLAHRIIRFNGDPPSWWIGQFVKFVLKPRVAMQRTINKTIAEMNFNTPIVGVHIRRTDKVGTEAALHHIHEYMTHVKNYYDQLALTQPVGTRRVYLATDDATVLDDARSRYPEYEFLGDPTIAKTAATHRRYTPASLKGLMVDLHMLSMCDYIVCTFSSQVGRTAYEMMQANRLDASNSFFSLDDIYYFGGQGAHDRAAVMAHEPLSAQEIAFQVGDLIGVAGNHWNGFGRGTNKRTNLGGLIPWYKTADHLVLYPFPEYKHVPLYGDTRQNEL